MTATATVPPVRRRHPDRPYCFNDACEFNLCREAVARNRAVAKEVARWFRDQGLPSLPRHYDPEPIVRRVQARGGFTRLTGGRDTTRSSEASLRVSRLYRMWTVAASGKPLTVAAVDELCHWLLDMHPIEVYGDAWLEPAEFTLEPHGKEEAK